ncbi:MAG: hypothetical protein NVSMB23_01940 [Myxococcales bacterium]
MNLALVEKVARAVLYEGFLLYPYRPSAVKNRQRWTFGALYPPDYCDQQGDACEVQAECLVRGGAESVLEVRARFLHLMERAAGPRDDWQQATEREVIAPEARLGELVLRPAVLRFSFPGTASPLQEPICGTLALSAVACGPQLFRLTARLHNDATVGPGASRAAALMRALASTHLLLGVRDGEFVSQIDPPDQAREAAAACRNTGVFPVLVGSKDTMLASPIILYDFPQIAPESPGDLFDSGEIDEILTLRILTLTDDEKREMRGADPRAKALLDRTEALGEEEMLKLHGVLRAKARAVSDGVEIKPGHRVRLRPRPGGDIFDVALAGKAATVSSVEEDFEGRIFLALTIDDDPGKDLGLEGKPGHRFFFRPEEVEPLQ